MILWYSRIMAEEIPWPLITYESRPWQRADDIIASRKQILAARGPYSAAVVPTIAHQNFTLSGQLQALTEDAAGALARFDSEVGAVAAPFSSILLRTESASSSEIENLTSGAQQIALAELGQSQSENAQLIVGNVRAMMAALELSEQLDGHAVIEMHRALLERSNPEMVGHWRDEQVWIGGGGVSPHSATFVPPHDERVPALMEDMLAFARRTDLPLLAQTAIAHAQFETIHPFPDGNGRTGRALIQGMLRSGGLTRSVTVPVSAGLLQNLDGYIAALTEYRLGNIEPIVTAIAEASFAAIRNGRALVADIEHIQERWAHVVKARSDSSVHRLQVLLLRQPVVDSGTAAQLLGVTSIAAQQSINRLVDADVLEQFGSGKRNRLWRAREVLDALDQFAARAKRRG